MIDDSPVVAIVPARAGSKGLPGKNLMSIGGTSLVGRAIAAARGSRFVDRVVLSTDGEAIAEEGRRHGAEVPFLRPPELASDEATTADVIRHALSVLGMSQGYLVLLQPTSPLRSSQDIDDCLELCRSLGAPAAVSVSPVDKSPYWMFHVGSDQRLVPVVAEGLRPSRRQDSRPAVVLNGAVYVVDVATFLATGSFVPAGCVASQMPSERAVDIDTAEDLARARALVAAGGGAPIGRPPARHGHLSCEPVAAGNVVGRYSCRTGIVIGPGASVVDQDFPDLEGAVLVAADAAIASCQAAGLRPHYVVAPMRPMTDAAAANLEHYCRETGARLLSVGEGHGAPVLAGADHVVCTFDAGVVLPVRWSTSLHAAIAVGLAMGFRDLAIIGGDIDVLGASAGVGCDQIAALENAVLQGREYIFLNLLASKRGQRLINASEGGHLDVLIRQPLARVLSAR